MDDLVLLPLSHVVYAHVPHPDVIVQEEVEELKHAVQPIVVRSGWKRRIGDRGICRFAFDRLREAIER